MRDRLLASCARLAHPPAAAVNAYAAKQEAIAAAVTAAMLARPDLHELVSDPEMMADNHRNHARFFSALLADFVPELFLDTVHWVYRAYRAHGFASRYWEILLPLWREVMARELPAASARAIGVYYDWLGRHHAELWALSEQPARVGEG